MHILEARPFADLLSDPEQLKAVTDAFTRMIGVSFAGAGQMRRPTAAEIKRRFGICERWFRTLRADLHWSVQRSLDEIPRALAAELRGETYEPAKRSVWVPSDGAP